MTNAPDPEFLTVRELAELLRLKERKVYDLAASGAVPCSRATGKLLFPAREVRDWIARSGSGGATEASPRPPIVLGSHDPLLDWALRASRCGLASFYDGSHDGLARFARGEGIAAGLHIRDPETGAWNVPAVTRAEGMGGAVLVRFARRQRGLVSRADAPALAGLADLTGLRFAPRQPESGAHDLFSALGKAEGIDPDDITLTDVVRTEDDAVGAVQRGEADATFGLMAVARSFGCAFTPVIEEEFALLVDRKAWFDPPFQSLLAFCRTAAFTDRATAFGGYDLAGLGEVLWNG